MKRMLVILVGIIVGVVVMFVVVLGSPPIHIQ